MTKHKLTLGLNTCSNADYHGDKSFLSSSNLKLLLKDPEKFKKEFIDGESISISRAAFDEGSYAHTLILEPHEVLNEYAFFPGFRKHGVEWDEFVKENSGKIILSKPQKHRVEQWVSAYNQLPFAKELVSGGKAEMSIASELFGVPVKVRADYVNVDKGYIVDVKTTSYPTDVDSFKWVMQSLGYPLSAAMYTQVFSSYFGKAFDFYFVVLGKKDNSCEVYKCSDSTIESGSAQVLQAINLYKLCMQTGVWTRSQNSAMLINSEDYEIREV